MPLKVYHYLPLFALMLLPAWSRTWTSLDGKKIEAELVSVEGDSVVLSMKGREYRYPIAKLSEADREYIEESKDADPGEKPSASQGTWELFGQELKPGATTEAVGPLEDNVIRELSKNTLKPTQMKVKVRLPEDFDPSKPQKVFWSAAAINNEEERLQGNLATFFRSDIACPKGWIVIAGDTEHGNPKELKEGLTGKGDHLFHAQLVEEMTKVWPDFKNWKHACGGHSGGAKASFFRIAQLLKSDVNVVGGFFSGCNECMVSQAIEEIRVRKSAWRDIKAYHSTGDKDSLVPEDTIKRVADEMKSSGLRKIKVETFPGGHAFSNEQFAEALDWFVEEEP